MSPEGWSPCREVSKFLTNGYTAFVKLTYTYTFGPVFLTPAPLFCLGLTRN